MKLQDLREWQKKKEGGKEKNSKTSRTKVPVFSPFFLPVTPGWDLQIGELHLSMVHFIVFTSTFV